MRKGRSTRWWGWRFGISALDGAGGLGVTQLQGVGLEKLWGISAQALGESFLLLDTSGARRRSFWEPAATGQNHKMHCPA